MTMHLPPGWSQLELTRRTPHCDYAVTLYDDGSVYVVRWMKGDEYDVRTRKFETVEAAVSFCERDLAAIRAAASSATCGPVNVDADGRSVE